MKPSLVLATLVAGVAVAAVLAVAVLAAAPGPDYLDVAAWNARSLNDNAARLSVTTRDEIPRQPDAFIGAQPVVGLAWADLATRKAFVTTIHPVIGRDSHQNPDAWHAHTVTLASGATAPNDFCLASIDSTPTAGIQIHGSTMRVNVRQSELPVAPEAIDAAAGFTVVPDAACASGLAVLIRDAA
jgi:hypothetical protein